MFQFVAASKRGLNFISVEDIPRVLKKGSEVSEAVLILISVEDTPREVYFVDFWY